MLLGEIGLSKSGIHIIAHSMKSPTYGTRFTFPQTEASHLSGSPLVLGHRRVALAQYKGNGRKINCGRDMQQWLPLSDMEAWSYIMSAWISRPRGYHAPFLQYFGKGLWFRGQKSVIICMYMFLGGTTSCLGIKHVHTPYHGDGEPDVRVGIGRRSPYTWTRPTPTFTSDWHYLAKR